MIKLTLSAKRKNWKGSKNCYLTLQPLWKSQNRELNFEWHLMLIRAHHKSWKSIAWSISDLAFEVFHCYSFQLWGTDHHPDDVEPAIRQSLKDLNLDYFDAYLIHWPTPFVVSWSELNLRFKSTFLKTFWHVRQNWKQIKDLT